MVEDLFSPDVRRIYLGNRSQDYGLRGEVEESLVVQLVPQIQRDEGSKELRKVLLVKSTL
jgi:hypothetical protein